MKVLRVIPTLDPEMGGPQTTIVNAAIAEAQAQLETTIVFAGDKQSARSTAPARNRLEEVGVSTRMFPRASGVPSGAASRLGISRQMSVWLLRNVHRYDVIHVDYVWAMSTLLAAIAGSRAKRPVVLTAHESLTRFGIHCQSRSGAHVRTKLWLRGLLMRYVDLLVMTSEMEYADSVRPGEAATVIPHPVTSGPPATLVASTPIPPLTVGYIGRLHPKKNVDILLRAIAGLDTPVRLIVCGDGDPAYRSELRRLATVLAVDDHVEWRGHVDARGRAELFAESHVVAMPSAYECFGMAAAEAMTAGVPVIVSRSTGVAPVVEEYDCGKIVEAGDENSLGTALEDVAKDETWRDGARVRSLKAAAENYDFGSYGTRISAAYAKLIDRTAG